MVLDFNTNFLNLVNFGSIIDPDVSFPPSLSVLPVMGDDLPKIKMSRLLHLTYLYLHKLINLQITSLVSVTEPTYISLKSRIVKSLKRLVDTFKKLGGRRMFCTNRRNGML